MSVRIMGQVWDLSLPHADKFVLLAMADHADHDGNNVYPSVRTVALKTGYSERQVQRVISSLETAGLLVAVQQRDGAATVYKIDTTGAEKVDTRQRPARIAPPLQPISAVFASPKGVSKCHPCQNVTPDIHDTKNGQNVTPRGDIYDTPSYSLYEPSLQPSLEPKSVCEIVPVFAEDFTEKSADNSAKKPIAKKTGYDADMLAFWEAYPLQGRVRSSMLQTQQAWGRMSSADRAAARAGLERALKVAQFCEWPKGVHTWLSDRCYETFTEKFTPEITRLEADKKREADKPYVNRNEVPSARTVTAAAPRQIGVAERDRLRREAKEAAGSPC